MKKLVYIGNILKGTNPTTTNHLMAILTAAGFSVFPYSSNKNKFVRLLHMCLGVLKHKNAAFILIDTYSTQNFYYALVISQLAKFFNINYIPILHGGNLPKRLLNNPTLSKLIFENAFVNVAPSKYLFEVFSNKKYNTVYIPNAIAIKNYPFKNRIKFNPKILWVRAFDEIYNPLMAVEALVNLKKKYPQAQLCMIGPDKDGSFEKTKQLVGKLNLKQAVEFTGYLSKEDWIKKSENYDVFINTTCIDNTPVSVIEAMALGLPIVSTNVGGMPYLIKHKHTGLLVESNNSQQMVNEISWLIENPKMATKIAENAREMVVKFNEDIVSEHWKKLLN